MSDSKVTYAQLKVMVERTRGYGQNNEFEFFVTAQGIVYLTVFHVVYCIDQTGMYYVRRKSDGSLIDSEPNHV